MKTPLMEATEKIVVFVGTLKLKTGFHDFHDIQSFYYAYFSSINLIILFKLTVNIVTADCKRMPTRPDPDATS